MKNKTFFLLLVVLSSLVVTSCASTRSGYGNQRKGYGCPNTVTIGNPAVEKNKV